MGVIVFTDEPEAWLMATTLNSRFQDAGLDGNGGAFLEEPVRKNGLLLCGVAKMFLSIQKRKWLLGGVLAVAAGSLAATASAHGDKSGHEGHGQWPQASLQAQASGVVSQDTVRVTLASELTGASQTAVAQDLSKLLDGVMADAKKSDKVKVSSGNYRVWPTTGKDGKISSWHGRGEIFLESTDFAAASKLAEQLSDRMPVAGLDFSVSRALRDKEEKALLQDAVHAFRERSQALATALGYDGYRIREVRLGGGGGYVPNPAPRMMAMAAAPKADVPLEAGTETITVSVQGTIFLRSSKK